MNNKPIHANETVQALDEADDDLIKAAEVLEYLQCHPDFFKQNADVISNIQLANAKTGNVISMAHWQADVLRHKTNQHRSRLEKLVAQSSLNQSSYEKLLDLVVGWLAQNDSSQLPHQIESDLKVAFGLDAIMVMVWDKPNRKMLYPERAEWREHVSVFVSSLHTPYCGPCKGYEVEAQLAAQVASGQIASLAMVPLWGARGNEHHCLGVLLMGAQDVSRFTPDMGTHLLNSIGEMVGAALSRI